MQLRSNLDASCAPGNAACAAAGSTMRSGAGGAGVWDVAPSAAASLAGSPLPFRAGTPPVQPPPSHLPQPSPHYRPQEHRARGSGVEPVGAASPSTSRLHSPPQPSPMHSPTPSLPSSRPERPACRPRCGIRSRPCIPTSGRGRAAGLTVCAPSILSFRPPSLWCAPTVGLPLALCLGRASPWLEAAVAGRPILCPRGGTSHSQRRGGAFYVMSQGGEGERATEGGRARVALARVCGDACLTCLTFALPQEGPRAKLGSEQAPSRGRTPAPAGLQGWAQRGGGGDGGAGAGSCAGGFGAEDNDEEEEGAYEDDFDEYEATLKHDPAMLQRTQRAAAAARDSNARDAAERQRLLQQAAQAPRRRDSCLHSTSTRGGNAYPAASDRLPA